MFWHVWNLIFESKFASKFSDVIRIRLLLFAKSRGFLNPNDKNTKALFKKFQEIEFIEGIAVLESHSSGNAAIMDAIEQNGEKIVQMICYFRWHLQLCIMHHCTDTCIFAMWCKNITQFVEKMLEKMAEKKNGVTAHMILAAISNVCGSEYFAKNVLDPEVVKLVRMLLRRGNVGLKYVDAFFIAACERHRRAAKKELYNVYTAQPMTEEEAAAMAAMGFKIMQKGPGHFVPDETGVSLDKKIGGADMHRLLELVRDKIE